MGENKQTKNKTEHQTRVKLKKEQKVWLNGVNRISEVVVRGFPQGVESGIPQGKLIDFPWEGLALLKKDGCCVVQVYWVLKIPQPLPQDSP